MAGIVVLGVAATALPAGADLDPPAPTYRPPIDGPVVDAFRPPAHPYGPGNRGLEYGAIPGTPVRAAGAGMVTFAGLVAGSRHVTVLHPDGLRTTVSYLDDISVVVGQHVEQGDQLGTSSMRLHFSARQGDAYLDPAALFEPGPPRVHLVPFDTPPGEGADGERSAIRQLLGLGASIVGAAGAVVGGSVDAGRDAAAWAVDHGDDLVRLALEYGPLLHPGLRTALLLRTSFEVAQHAWEIATRPCTSSDVPVARPQTRHVAVLVAGLGSTSENGAIDDVDVGELGYDAGDVLRFSYSGGRTPDPTDRLDDIEATRYDKADTQEDLRHTAARLADLIEDVAERAGPTPIDVYAHSQGGVVARLALIELERRHGTAWLERLGLFATIATPHDGADLATAAYGVGLFPTGDLLLDLPEPLLGLDDDAPGAAQLSETSDVIAELAEHPVPTGVPTISVAARGDVVVPVPRARFEGARETVVPLVGPTAHDRLPGDPRTTRELALALAGAPPACTSFVTALADQAFGAGISSIEDQIGALGTAGSWAASRTRMAP
jgi:hypothetical protein